uniref:Small ribosomal subunit protein uS19c n=3 Tax=Undaria pinnatifida TaxID=74381 RepID=V9PB13_UNDPI|nr:ribosomal protein S19 [Undaria pinnatifida]YP_011008435.1 ribosomal protein S19 [Undaria peterseniana]AGW46834.1 ribosomal protein S19 [Undaria pinnatifida]WBP70406.1 ribosomal protein S19 [Undaria peterseniana]
MSRSNWKTPFIDKSLLKRLTPKQEKKPTWSRRSTIYPAAVGLKLQIYNGKDMISRKIKPEMVGHKLGEFVATRKNFVAKKKK